MPDYFIGLMSGTSMDGIDAVLVRFGDPGVEILAQHTEAYPETLRFALQKAAATPADEPIDQLGSLDRQVGEYFRNATLALLDSGGVPALEVTSSQPGPASPRSLTFAAPTSRPVARARRWCRHFTTGCSGLPGKVA
jgi:1,6-anhydro-N-acetylmuramate kinase